MLGTFCPGDMLYPASLTPLSDPRGHSKSTESLKAEELLLQAHPLPPAALRPPSRETALLKICKLATQPTGPVKPTWNIYQKQTARATAEEDNIRAFTVFAWPAPMPNSLASGQKEPTEQQNTMSKRKNKVLLATCDLKNRKERKR